MFRIERSAQPADAWAMGTSTLGWVIDKALGALFTAAVVAVFAWAVFAVRGRSEAAEYRARDEACLRFKHAVVARDLPVMETDPNQDGYAAVKALKDELCPHGWQFVTVAP